MYVAVYDYSGTSLGSRNVADTVELNAQDLARRQTKVVGVVGIMGIVMKYLLKSSFKALHGHYFIMLGTFHQSSF
jgi:predicted membrane channel-forming protein YqfA (hemolysin III family)